MSLALLTLALLCARPACAQNNTGGNWNVTDQDGNALTSDPNGGGYNLRGPMTGSKTLTGAYPDVLTAAQQPNASTGYAFTPNPSSYQGWLFTGAPDSGYDPYHIWTEAEASNNAPTYPYGSTGYLGNPWNENINGSITANTGGTLWAVFQWSDPYPAYYYAYMNQTPPTPPKYIDVLLSTSLGASAYGSPASGGMSASAMATDSLNETAQASWDSGPGSGVPTVTGRHLLRVSVDPTTHQAQVSLGGHDHGDGHGHCSLWGAWILSWHLLLGLLSGD